MMDDCELEVVGRRMHADPVIEALRARLVRDHAVHTVLLYGSRANGTCTPDSDYDVAAFGPVPDTQRITHAVGDAYLDVFVYPESMLRDPPDDLLRLRGSSIVMQRDAEASAFLECLDARFDAGPTGLNPGEVQARCDWLQKMAVRMRRGDAEANFRRAWLLTALLEDYFVLRGRWYEGPKKSLAWLKANDPSGLALFEVALAPGAAPETIDGLVRHVMAGASPRSASR